MLNYQFSQHSSYTLFNTGWENWGDDTWELRVNKQAASLDKTISPREESLFNSCFQMGAFLGLEKNGIVNIQWLQKLFSRATVCTYHLEKVMFWQKWLTRKIRINQKTFYQISKHWCKSRFLLLLVMSEKIFFHHEN